MSKDEFKPDFEFETHLDEELSEPPKYKVLLHNDDYTTMDFVVRVLKEIFYKSDAEAMNIMLRVHRKGVGVCGVFTAEVAETKVALVHTLAKNEGYPLRSSMEEV